MQSYLYFGVGLIVYLSLDSFIKDKLFKEQSFAHKRILKNIIRAVIFLVFSLTILSELGLDVNAIITSFGITGLAVSLASREALSNLISGVAMQIQRQFSVGDTIKVKGFVGRVIKINIRDTVLKTDEGLLVVPNRIMLSEPVLIIES